MSNNSSKIIQISTIVLIGLMVIWLIVLPIRSLIYVGRIISELQQPVKTTFEQIKVCKDNKIESFEQERFYNYLMLGEICED